MAADKQKLLDGACFTYSSPATTLFICSGLSTTIFMRFNCSFSCFIFHFFIIWIPIRIKPLDIEFIPHYLWVKSNSKPTLVAPMKLSNILLCRFCLPDKKRIAIEHILYAPARGLLKFKIYKQNSGQNFLVFADLRTSTR